MKGINVLKNEQVFAQGENFIGGEYDKIEKIYQKLKRNNADELNFRLLKLDNLIDFVKATGYDRSEINYDNILYDLRYDPIYSNN